AVPDLAHKTEAGAVVAGIPNAAALRAAAERMAHLGDRFLVEAMVPSPVAELIVGVTRDPQFGLVLTIGAGGALVELLADVRTLLFPVS
ncbi:MAG: CoA-binding protein, partial [Gammaproteobacteria bacterium]|nr:CoA-binding protein [Gammaproteobacteria bacterium]